MGWEVMKRFTNSLLGQRGAALHGLAGVPHVQGTGPVAGGLRDHVLEALIGGNAARLLERA